jgi:hypothetical protein
MQQPRRRHMAARFTVFAAIAVSLSSWAEVPSFSQVPAIKGNPNFCMGKDDGAYKHPDCRVRYACDGGAASQVNCPSGQVFDPAKNPDDNPAKAYCGAPQSVDHVDCSGIGMVK